MRLVFIDDSEQRKPARQWLSNTLQLTEYGTRHVEAEHVVMPIVIAPSDRVSHSQLADPVTSATTAAVAGRPFALELLEPLREIARTRPSGECSGVGLVLWPPPLYDLYWWLLDEPYLRRGNVGVPLGPHAGLATATPDRPFLLHDGLTGVSRAS